MAVKKYNGLDTDTSLGGSNAADDVVSSQKAVKTYIDNHSGGGGGGSYTAGDGIIIQNDEISVDAESTAEVDVEQISEVTVAELLATIDGYDATKTQTLKNINGTFSWVTEV